MSEERNRAIAMDASPERPAEGSLSAEIGRFLHGVRRDGIQPVVVVPARVACILQRLAGLDRLRIDYRGHDGELDGVLAAFAVCDRWIRASDSGTQPAELGSDGSSSLSEQRGETRRVRESTPRRSDRPRLDL
jgi:hypothetical protein